MKYFFVRIDSITYNLYGAANVLAESEEQATKHVSNQFHESVNTFMKAGHERRDAGEYKEIDKEILLRDAKIKVRLISDGPMIINSEWDKIK